MNIDLDNIKELENLSEKERQEVLKILKEYSETGNSKSFDGLILEDYDEIPVDIETFLHNEQYLGKALIDEEGRFTVFPYWEDLLKRVFPDPLKPAICNTLALTGGIGLGKSTAAVIIVLYELYRMLCLKNPYTYYGLQPIDLITFAVINITIDAAKGVAWNKLQSMIQVSPWFMSHGTVNKADMPEWKPPKGIELIYGSLQRHVIGRAIFSCLDKDTVIKTVDGDFKLEDLVGKIIKVYNYDNSGAEIASTDCFVLPTKQSKEEIEIVLEDDTVIRCTPEHKFLLDTGEYKEAKYLTKDDNIVSL